MCPEDTVHDCCVKDVQSGLGDCALGGVLDAKRDRQGEMKVNHLVLDASEGRGCWYP